MKCRSQVCLVNNTPINCWTLWFTFWEFIVHWEGEEHRQLRRPGHNSQFRMGTDGDGVKYLIYKADPKSKTNQGGLTGHLSAPKTINIYLNKTDSLWCCVHIFEKYISLLPVDGKKSSLYLHPLSKMTKDQWYSDRPLGVNTLREMVKCLASAAGLTGKFTNHSLRATAASRMYQAGVPEKFIKEITGHKSDAVCCYKCTSDSMKWKVSAMMSNPGNSEICGEKSDEIDLTEENVEWTKMFKKMCKGVHPLLQCIQSSGIDEIVNSVPGECVKSVKVQVEIECKEKWAKEKWV